MPVRYSQKRKAHKKQRDQEIFEVTRHEHAYSVSNGGVD